MNDISYFYQVIYVSNSGKIVLKLPTDLGPGILAHFLQSALIQSNYMDPFVHLGYRITYRQQRQTAPKTRRVKGALMVSGRSFYVFP